MTQSSPSPGELAHYGVKGMRWGVRKANDAPNKNYKTGHRQQDTEVFGARGAKRINRRMNKGQTRSKAVGREVLRTAAKRGAMTIGTVAVMAALGEVGSRDYSSISSSGRSAMTKGRASVNQTIGRGREKFSPTQRGQVKGVQMRIPTSSSPLPDY